MAIAVERDVSPKRGAIIKLETRADLAEFYSALVAGKVKGVGSSRRARTGKLSALTRKATKTVANWSQAY